MIVLTPPLGWNTWNTFGLSINEKLVLESAEAIVASGLRDAGYEYIVLDDGWSLPQRDENGRLVPDPQKFPRGIGPLADDLHSMGLKLGIYSCAGYISMYQDVELVSQRLTALRNMPFRIALVSTKPFFRHPVFQVLEEVFPRLKAL